MHHGVAKLPHDMPNVPNMVPDHRDHESTPSRTGFDRINTDMIEAVGDDDFFNPQQAIADATVSSNDTLLAETSRRMDVIPTPRPRPINTGIRAVTNEWLYYNLRLRLRPDLNNADGWTRDILDNLWTFWIVDSANDHPARFRHDRHPGDFSLRRQHSIDV